MANAALVMTTSEAGRDNAYRFAASQPMNAQARLQEHLVRFVPSQFEVRPIDTSAQHLTIGALCDLPSFDKRCKLDRIDKELWRGGFNKSGLDDVHSLSLLRQVHSYTLNDLSKSCRCPFHSNPLRIGKGKMTDGCQYERGAEQSKGRDPFVEEH